MTDPFDDAVSIWMALLTECERLKHVIETKAVTEPMFGRDPITSSKMLTDVEVAATKERLARVEELAKMAFDRRAQLGAVFQ